MYDPSCEDALIMPVPNSTFRAVCGQFYWTFQHFMSERAKMARGARVCVIRACWPLRFVRTVFVCTALLAMCSTNDKHLDLIHSVVFEAGCERKDSSSTQQPIAALQTSMQMLAIATRFARMAHHAYGAPGRYVIVVLYSGVLAGMSAVGVAVTVCLVGYLLACGDVEQVSHR